MGAGVEKCTVRPYQLISTLSRLRGAERRGAGTQTKQVVLIRLGVCGIMRMSIPLEVFSRDCVADGGRGATGSCEPFVDWELLRVCCVGWRRVGRWWSAAGGREQCVCVGGGGELYTRPWEGALFLSPNTLWEPFTRPTGIPSRPLQQNNSGVHNPTMP